MLPPLLAGRSIPPILQERIVARSAISLGFATQIAARSTCNHLTSFTSRQPPFSGLTTPHLPASSGGVPPSLTALARAYFFLLWTKYPSFRLAPESRRATRNPSLWIPACAGMTQANPCQFGIRSNVWFSILLPQAIRIHGRYVILPTVRNFTHGYSEDKSD